MRKRPMLIRGIKLSKGLGPDTDDAGTRRLEKNVHIFDMSQKGHWTPSGGTFDNARCSRYDSFSMAAVVM